MKTKSKSLISIILSIMMVLSMVIVAVPVNAATVEDNSVGDTTYYLWYANTDKPSGYNNKVQMTQSGSSYVATVNTNGSNFYFLINNSSSSSTSSLVWNNNNKPTVTADSTFANWTGQSNYSSYIIVKGQTSKSSMTVTFNPSANTVDLATGSVVTTKTWHIIGGKDSMFGSWNATDTTTPIDTPYNGSSTIFYAEITFPKNYKSYFRLNDGSSQYSLSNSKELGIGDSNNKQTLVVESSKAMWFDNTSSSSDTKVNFFIDTASNKVWYELVGTEPTTYTVETASTSNGTFDVSATSATMGTTVTISNITPASGYEFDSITASGGATLTPVTEGLEYTFTMPASNVTVTVTFKAVDTPSTDWYLSGTLYENNKYTSLDAANSEYKMEDNGNNIYTLTYTYPSSVARFYVVVNDGKNDYHPTNTEAPSGTPADPDKTNSTGPSSAPSWLPSFTAGDTVRFTWDATTKKLTWEEIVEVSSKWSLVGDFNDWVATENPMHESNGTYTTSLYLPANSTGYDFKILNNEATGNEHGFYGKLNTEIPDTTNGVTLDNTDSVHSSGNVVLKTSGGVYTFTWVESTKKLTVAKGSTYTLTSTGTIPDTVGAGEDLNMTINADYTGNPEISYYKYTVKAGAKSVASGVKNTSSTYNCKTTLSTNSTITYFVKAYNANDELIGLTATGSKDVTVTVGNFKVDLRVDKTEVIEKETFTLTATVDPADYAGTYKFFQSTDGQTYTQLGSATSSNTKTVSLATKGKYYFKVEVTNKYDSSSTVESYRIEVDVYDTASTSHKVKIYFKSASSFIYAPTLTLNNGTAQSMTKNEDKFIGNAYSGSLKFYWYELDVTFDSTKDNTITFKTGRTQVNASFTSRFLADEYYFAVDNLMSDRTVYNLTTANEAIRNFYHSPLNMVTMGDTSDGNLGFTNVNGQTVKMGSILTATVDVTGATVIQASFSIRSATVAQKIAAEIEEVSDTQYSLLDVNLDGDVDVRDATLMQKALVNA